MKTEIVYTGRHFTLKKTGDGDNINTYFNINSVLDTSNELISIDKNLYNYNVKRKLYIRMTIKTVDVLISKIKAHNIKGIKFTGVILDIYKDGMFDWDRDLNWSCVVEINGKKESLTYCIKKCSYNHIFTKLFIKKYNKLK